MDIEIRIPKDPTGIKDTSVVVHCDCSVTIKQHEDTVKVGLTRTEMDALVSAYQSVRNRLT